MGGYSDFASSEQGRAPAALSSNPGADLTTRENQASSGLPVHQRLRFLVERGILTRIPPSAHLLVHARAAPGATIYANNCEIVSSNALAQ